MENLSSDNERVRTQTLLRQEFWELWQIIFSQKWGVCIFFSWKLFWAIFEQLRKFCKMRYLRSFGDGKKVFAKGCSEKYIQFILVLFGMLVLTVNNIIFLGIDMSFEIFENWHVKFLFLNLNLRKIFVFFTESLFYIYLLIRFFTHWFTSFFQFIFKIWIIK